MTNHDTTAAGSRGDAESAEPKSAPMTAARRAEIEGTARWLSAAVVRRHLDHAHAAFASPAGPVFRAPRQVVQVEPVMGATEAFEIGDAIESAPYDIRDLLTEIDRLAARVTELEARPTEADLLAVAERAAQLRSYQGGVYLAPAQEAADQAVAEWRESRARQ